MDRHPRISIDRRVCHGKPVIEGTRVLVTTVLGCIAGGDSVEDVARAFGMTEDDVRAAVAYALELLNTERHFPPAA